MTPEGTIKQLKEYILGMNYMDDEAVWMAIKALEQQPKTGYWIEKEDCNLDIYYDCSECGESFCLIDGTPTDYLYNYCPNCGAKMQEVEEWQKID